MPLPRQVDARLCEFFIRLAEGEKEMIRRFAARWGPLHYPRSDVVLPGTETETVEEWQRFATLARALLRCSAAFGRGEYGIAEDWQTIALWLGIPTEARPRPAYRRILLAQALNLWYARSPGNALVTLHKNKIVLQSSSTSLFGIIGVQLAQRITNRAVLVCYHCNRVYWPKNPPRTGVRHFCSPCQADRKPEMYAMRDLRARQKRPG